MGEFGFEEFVFWSALGSYYAVRTFQQRSRQATRLALEKAQLETSLRQLNWKRCECAVQDEIALTQDYLAVEKMRFGDRLTILSEVAPDSGDALMPSFLLQPLVENAVIHGLRGVSQAGRIALRTDKGGGALGGDRR